MSDQIDWNSVTQLLQNFNDQLGLMNQLAMNHQFQQQGMSLTTSQPQSSTSFGALNITSPSTNSLLAMSGEETDCAVSSVKIEADFTPSSQQQASNGSKLGQNEQPNNSQLRSRLIFDPRSELVGSFFSLKNKSTFFSQYWSVGLRRIRAPDDFKLDR